MPRTRSELAATTGLARSTVAAHIDALLASGLVKYAGESASSGGRPPARVAFNPAARLVAAIEIGNSQVRVAVTDLDGKVIEERAVPRDTTDGPRAVLEQAIGLLDGLLASSSGRVAQLAGVGVAWPGTVDAGSGRPSKPHAVAGWEDSDIVSYFQQFLPVPVLVDSTVNMMALGEQATHWPGHGNFFFLNVAEHISSGIISSGQLQRGANGTAGDLGHVQLAHGVDTVCKCGNYGCLEALASVPAIARHLRSKGLNVEEEADIRRLVAAGSTHAIQAARQAGRDIGDVLATVVNLLNPSVIVVGGVHGEFGEQVVAGIREVIYRRCPPLATSGLQVAPVSAGDQAALYGASTSVIQYVLSSAAVHTTLTHSPMSLGEATHNRSSGAKLG